MDEKEYKVGKDILKTTLRTLLAIVAVFVFAAVGMFVISPQTTAKICETLGFKHLEASCYELVYARSKNNADLYNLIVKLGGTKQYNKQSNYINVLQNNTDYSEFCDNFDDSVIAKYNSGQISAKNYVSLYGLNEYLSSAIATDYVAINKLDEAYSAIIATKSSDRQFELAVYYYVDYLYSEKVSEAQCQTYMQKLADGADGNMIDYLTHRLTILEGSGNIDSAEKGIRLLAKYTKVKITYAKYVICKVTENAGEEDARQAWQNAVTAYNAEVA